MGNSNQSGLSDPQICQRNKGWPLFFHSTHSPNIELTSDQRTARRIETFCNGICFSNRPVVLGERVHLRFVQVSTSWSGVLRFGFTIHDPDLLTTLPRYACPDLTNKYGYWAKALPEKFANQDTVVSFEVGRSGDVMLAVNGEEKGIFLGKVATTLPLWGLLDIYGNTNAVEFIDERMVLLKELPSPATQTVFNNNNFHCHNNHNQQQQRINNNNSLSSLHHHDTSTLPLIKHNPFLSPLSFHPLTGKNIILSQNNSTATRLPDEYCNGYVFTSRPILPGEKLVIQILALDSAFTGGVAFGMTSCDLSTLTSADLPDDADLLLDRREYWVVNKDVCSAGRVADELAFTFTHAGEVKYYRNQHLVSTLMHVDVAVSMSAFFDVYGNAQQIRLLGVFSELFASPSSLHLPPSEPVPHSSAALIDLWLDPPTTSPPTPITTTTLATTTAMVSNINYINFSCSFDEQNRANNNNLNNESNIVVTLNNNSHKNINKSNKNNNNTNNNQSATLDNYTSQLISRTSNLNLDSFPILIPPTQHFTLPITTKPSIPTMQPPSISITNPPPLSTTQPSPTTSSRTQACPTTSYQQQPPPKLFPRKMSANPILLQSKTSTTAVINSVNDDDDDDDGGCGGRSCSRNTPCHNNSLDMLLIRQKHLLQQQQMQQQQQIQQQQLQQQKMQQQHLQQQQQSIISASIRRQFQIPQGTQQQQQQNKSPHHQQQNLHHQQQHSHQQHSHQYQQQHQQHPLSQQHISWQSQQAASNTITTTTPCTHPFHTSLHYSTNPPPTIPPPQSPSTYQSISIHQSSPSSNPPPPQPHPSNTPPPSFNYPQTHHPSTNHPSTTHPSTNHPSTIHPSSTIPPPSTHTPINESDYLSDQLSNEECTVCMECAPNCVLYTCGHMCMCFRCATNLQLSNTPHCPICRQPIKDVIKIYKS